MSKIETVFDESKEYTIEDFKVGGRAMIRKNLADFDNTERPMIIRSMIDRGGEIDTVTHISEYICLEDNPYNYLAKWLVPEKELCDVVDTPYGFKAEYGVPETKELTNKVSKYHFYGIIDYIRICIEALEDGTRAFIVTSYDGSTTFFKYDNTEVLKYSVTPISKDMISGHLKLCSVFNSWPMTEDKEKDMKASLKALEKSRRLLKTTVLTK